jgi:hypothetical protein
MKASEMLQHAASIVGGQRAVDYGDKTTNHERIARLWDEWLSGSRALDGQPGIITAYDVAMMMLLVKVARLMHSPGHPDSHVDIAGYASILEEIANKESTP